MGSRRVVGTIYTTSPILVIHIAPSILLPTPVDPLPLSLFHLPATARPRIAILFLLPRACMYFSFSFISKAEYTWSEQETPWESEQSVFRGCVTYGGPRYHRRRAITRWIVAATTVAPAAGTRSITRMRFEFARFFFQPYVIVQIGRIVSHVRAQIVIRFSCNVEKHPDAPFTKIFARGSSIRLSDLYIIFLNDHFF